MPFPYPISHGNLDLGKESSEENAMRFTTSLAILLSAAVSVPVFGQDQEPMRQQLQAFLPPLDDALVGGRTYRDWLRDLSANDPALKESAIQSMVLYATEPKYIKEVRKAAGPALISILNDTSTADVSIRVNAALAVGTILLDEKDVERGVSALSHLLQDKESVVRLYATTALARFGADDRKNAQSLARKAIPSLVPEIHDKASWEIRRAAVAGLTNLAWDRSVKEGGPDPQAFRALAEAVNDRCLQVRQEAVKGFIYIGPPLISTTPKKGESTKADHSKAVEALEGILSQRDRSTAILARVALLQIDPPRLNNPVVINRYAQEISRMTRGPGDNQIRIDASTALTMIWQLANSNRVANRPDPKTFTKTSGWGEVIHTAVVNLADKDNMMVCWACTILGTMGPAAEKAIPDLEKLKARTNDPTTKKMAQRAIALCHGKEAGPVPTADRAGQ
jgi:hypothetical protein